MFVQWGVCCGRQSPRSDRAGGGRHLEADKRLPVKPWSRAPVAPATCPGVQADAGTPAWNRQGAGAARACACSTLTEASAVPLPAGGEAMPARGENVFPNPAMPPALLLPAVEFAGLPPVPAQDNDMSNWLTGGLDESAFWPFCLQQRPGVMDPYAASPFWTDDDKAFWQALLSPADSPTR